MRGVTCVRMAVACAHVRPMVARLWKKYAVHVATEGESIVLGLLPEYFEEFVTACGDGRECEVSAETLRAYSTSPRSRNRANRNHLDICL